MTVAADRHRLYKAVNALCLQAGTETNETVEWLCGPSGGMAKLFESYFAPKAAPKSFAEVHPPAIGVDCKCEHWQACKVCHPTYEEKHEKDK